MPAQRLRPVQRPVAEALEPKLLYSADLAPLAMAAGGTGLVDHATAQVAVPAVLAEVHAPREIAFVDAGLPDADALAADLAAQSSAGRSIEVILIHRDEDGLSQITDALAARSGLTAVHLITHGDGQGIQVGTSRLDGETLLAQAGHIAQWGQSLQAGGDVLIYGCDVASTAEGRAFLQDLAALTGSDVTASDDRTGQAALGGDWDLEFRSGLIGTTLAPSVAAQAAWQGVLASATPSSPGQAVWSESGFSTPQRGDWDGFTLGAQTNTVVNSTWTVMTSAQAPTRQEAIVVGVDANGDIRGQRWNGTSWIPLSSSPLGTGTAADRQGFAVAYEQTSGDAVLVWNDGEDLRYAVFNGTSWSSVQTIGAYAGAEPERMQIAAQPGGDKLALVISDANADDYALIWNGSSWGNAISLDTSGSRETDQVASSIAFESQSGRAVVAFGKANDPNVYYRVFSGSSWGSETAAGNYSESAVPGWITLASDPKSNRIAMGVMSVGNNDQTFVSFTVWNGSSWGSRTVPGSYTSSVHASSVAVGFEAASGDLLAVYGTTSSSLRYLTWSNSGGWSSAQTGPAVGAQPGVLRLYADPANNQLMLGVQNTSGALSFTAWTGTEWGTTTTVASATGSTTTPAFTWLWDTDLAANKTNTLWLGTDASSTSWSGLNQIGSGGVAEFGAGAGTTYGAGTTSGGFTHVFDATAFGATGLDDLVLVSRSVTLTAGLTVQKGDILFTVPSASTLTSVNSVSVDNNDVVLFRPATAGDYSRGTFTLLIDGLGASLLGGSPDVRGLTLVEQTTQLGDVTLQAGELLFTAGNGNSATTIYRFSPQSGGLLGGLLTGNISTLIAGAELGITKSITGVQLVSTATPLRNTTVPAGSLLITLHANNVVGSNALDVQAGDVVVLTPSTTSVYGAAQSTATMLLQGSAVGVTGKLDSLALSLGAAPVITSGATYTVNENTSTVGTIAATDADAGTVLTYRIVGGADAARFQINASTGALRFAASPNFESPTDTDANNLYQVVVGASDGTYEAARALTISVVNVNEAPDFTGSSMIVQVTAGGTAITQFTATDPDHGAVITYSLGSFLNESMMTIDAATGALSFKSAAVYDSSSSGNNYYQAFVYATDQYGASDSKLVLVQVVNPASVNQAPQIVSDGGLASVALQRPEGEVAVTTVQATDPEASAVTYALAGGVDKDRFEIDASTGVLRFKAAPDALAPADSDGDNVYEVIVSASDGQDATVQALTITVQAYNRPPVNTVPAGQTTQEDTGIALTGLSIADVDAGTGAVEVTLGTAHGTLAVRDDVAGGLTSAQIRYDADGRRVVLTGTVAQINATLAAANALVYQPDAEFSGTDKLTMRTDDLGLNGLPRNPADTVDVDEMVLTVTPVEDAPVIALNTLTIAQGGRAVPQVDLNDIDTADLSSIVLTASSVSGGRFVLAGTTTTVTQFTLGELDAGQIEFLQDGSATPPSYMLTASDGTAQSTPSTVQVAMDSTPVIVSDGGGAQATVSALEGQRAVTTVQASDAEGGPVHYSIVGGADAALFTIDASTGVLQFATSPDVRTAPFAGHGADYEVTVQASDGTSHDLQTLTVHLSTINRAPVNTLPAHLSVIEDTPLVLTGLAVADPDSAGAPILLSLTVVHGRLDVAGHVAGGVPEAQITRSADGRTLTLTGSVDALNATLASGTLVYTPVAQSTAADALSMITSDLGNAGLKPDGSGPSGPLLTTSLCTLTHIAVNDVPVITSGGGGAGLAVHVLEGQSLVAVVQAVDVESSALTYRIAGGADADLFILDAATGELRFVSAPDVTQPPFAGRGHVFQVVVEAWDGQAGDQQAVQVTLDTINRAPTHTTPSAYTTPEDTPLALTGLAIADADAGGGTITARLTVQHGTLSLRTDVVGGLNASQVARSPDGRSLQLNGTLAAINATLSASQGLVFRPDAERSGPDTLTLVTNDQGLNGLTPDGSGPSPALETTTIVPITVTVVNDAPQSSGHSLAITQGGSGVPVINVSDIDSSDAALTLTATAVRGGRFTDLDQGGATVTAFTLAQVKAGRIVFQQDGSSTSPAYTLTVTDGYSTVALPAPVVDFTAAPRPEPPPVPVPPPSTPAADAPAPASEAPPEDTAKTDGDTATSASPVGAATGAIAVEALPPTAAGLSAALTAGGLPAAPAVLVDAARAAGVAVEITSRPMDAAQTAVPVVDGFQYRWTGSLNAGAAGEELRRNLDALREQLQDHGLQRRHVVASSIAVSTGLSVGYVIWLVRGGALVGSMLSAMPAWQMIDPLPVLSRGRHRAPGEAGGGDDADVENLFGGDDLGDGMAPARPTSAVEPPAPHGPAPDPTGEARP